MSFEKPDHSGADPVGKFAVNRLVIAMVLCVCLGGCVKADMMSERVVVEPVPGGGIQPQVIAGVGGVIHIAYFVGDAAGGDWQYVTRTPGGTSTPIRINSQAGSAVAVGTVRGVQLALGRAGRVHAVWNGSAKAQPRVDGGMPLLYASFDPGQRRFTPQRNLNTWSGSVDGGGTIAADRDGGVYAAWHANPAGTSDAERAVYLARSFDDGVGFAREERISADKSGACACCNLRSIVDRQGTLSIVYRAAGADVNRDTMLLWSKNRGASFASVRVDPWKLEACPLSSFSIADGPRGLLAAWETNGQIRHAMFAPGAASPLPIADAPGSSQRKHPAVAVNHRGEYLVAWIENSGWARGGDVAWQIYGANGRPTADHGMAGKVPAWGLAAVAALPDGRFLLLR